VTQEGAIGLAVSGGGDSIAMMHCAAAVLDPKQVFVFTIDHGLRPDAVTEIALVAAQARALGLMHIVVKWQWDGTGNLQAAARAGRWCALSALAAEHNVRAIWMGHTQDDQIETFMMRLARGSGVDGLTAMQITTQRDGLGIFRPLLDISRADLRAWLTHHGIEWCDDPSNEDARFDRVRARQMTKALGDLGLTAKRVLQTIDHMQAAQRTLHHSASDFARDHIRQDGGDLIVAAQALQIAQADAPRRVFAGAIGWVGSRAFRPRFEQLKDVAARALQGETATLNGCILTPQKDGTFRLSREAAATKPMTATGASSDLIWDHRWRLSGPIQTDQTVKALGEGIKLCPDWRQTGTPRTSLLASPALWQDDALIAAPLAGLSNGWTAQIVANFHSRAFAIED
jgi:tRNA(Ile)-lysidine synthase